MPAPIVTTADSTETLPQKGYTVDQLIGYLYRQMGSPVWDIELSKQQIADCVQDALSFYSLWRPQIAYGAVKLVTGQSIYLQNTDCGLGVVHVDFVESTPGPTEIFYGNMISPAPLFRTGMDDYDAFMRWRKTWRRVTSVQPSWLWDDANQQLLIHNPIERFHAGVVIHRMYDRTEGLDAVGAMWVKEYALEKCRYLWGDVMSKFSGAIPGPMKDVQLDSQKRDKAEQRIIKLEERLQGMQLSTPISVD